MTQPINIPALLQRAHELSDVVEAYLDRGARAFIGRGLTPEDRATVRWAADFLKAIQADPEPEELTPEEQAEFEDLLDRTLGTVERAFPDEEGTEEPSRA